MNNVKMMKETMRRFWDVAGDNGLYEKMQQFIANNFCFLIVWNLSRLL